MPSSKGWQQFGAQLLSLVDKSMAMPCLGDMGMTSRVWEGGVCFSAASRGGEKVAISSSAARDLRQDLSWGCAVWEEGGSWCSSRALL